MRLPAVNSAAPPAAAGSVAQAWSDPPAWCRTRVESLYLEDWDDDGFLIVDSWPDWAGEPVGSDGFPDLDDFDDDGNPIPGRGLAS